MKQYILWKPLQQQLAESSYKRMYNQSEGWINLNEAAAHLNVSKSFLYQKGEFLGIPRVKLGSKYRYRKSDLDAWLLKNQGE